MQPRLNPYQAAPDAMKALTELEKYVRNSGTEQSLIELVKTRASQINGCAYCIYMHTRDARARGETEERLYLLDAWHESPLYTERERAALAWTEAVTLVSQTHVPDPVFEQVRRHFSEEELVKLTLLGTRRDVPFADPEWATGISRGCSTDSRHDIGWTGAARRRKCRCRESPLSRRNCPMCPGRRSRPLSSAMRRAASQRKCERDRAREPAGRLRRRRRRAIDGF